MSDYEIRMWAVQQAMNEYGDADQALVEAQKLYLFVTGQRTPVIDGAPFADNAHLAKV